MVRHFQFRRTFGLVRREGADRYLFLVLLSFVLSVSLTRFFLSLTGYPQIGGGELHIAHALWGGLFLFIAAILPLILSNRSVYASSAIIAGIGVGLFIDEVGKFITQSNNYFYPAAAPIVYTFFILTALLFLRYTRPANREDHAELSRALEEIQELLRHPLKPKARVALEERLTNIANNMESGVYATLVYQLLDFVQQDNRPVPSGRLPIYRPLVDGINHWMTTAKIKGVMIFGLLCLAFLALKNPASYILLDWTGPDSLVERLLSMTAGRHLEASAVPDLANIRMVLELMVGTLFLISVVLILARQSKPGVYLALTGLIIYFTAGNLIVFYFEQFSTLIMVAIQFAVLFVLLEFQRRSSRRTQKLR
jgi:hypothetical protein